jgi:hypothetical protein
MRSLHREEALGEGLSVEPSWRRPLRREPRVTHSCMTFRRSLFLKQKKVHGPPRPPPPGHRAPHHLAVVAACHRWPPPGRHRHLAWPSPPHVIATRTYIPPPPTHATYAAAHTYTYIHTHTPRSAASGAIVEVRTPPPPGHRGTQRPDPPPPRLAPLLLLATR